MESWIKLYRKFEEWEWYDDSYMVHLFIHLLLNASINEREWHGITVHRGQLVTSVSALASKLRITPKIIRNRLNKLQKTHELVIERANQLSLITICKYDSYQTVENIVGKERANGGQTVGKERATSKEYKEYNNISTSTAPAREESSFSSSALSSPPCHGGATPSQTSAPQKSPLLLSQLISSTLWHESLCMRFHIPRDALLAHIDSFAADMRDRDKDIGTDLSDAKNHFINWYMIQQRKNKDDTNQQKPRNKRRGVETGDTQSKNYHSSF